METRGFGAWESPISAQDVAAGAVPLGEVRTDGGDVYWLEGRPLEGGRYLVVRPGEVGPLEVTPGSFNVRTRVHEYGGGAFQVHQGVVYFSNFQDQRLYRQVPGKSPHPITPEPPRPASERFADAVVTPDGLHLVCVRESHPAEGEAVNDIVQVPTDGSSAPRRLVGGHDFFAAPRHNPDATRLCWLAWNHPRMPWDGTELWVAERGPDGLPHRERRVAGGAEEAVMQPTWGADGHLYFLSDRSGWWNLYRWDGSAARAVTRLKADLGTPAWVFALSSYALLDDGRAFGTYVEGGQQRAALIDLSTGAVSPLDLPYVEYTGIRGAGGRRVAFVGGAVDRPREVAVYDAGSRQTEVVRRASEQQVDGAYLSRPRSISFPTTDGATAHALYYPPTNADFRGPDGESPPLLVLSHGGPTSMATAGYDAKVQYWTSRGFGVVDVNYRGSSGYGRAYRQALNGQWGVADVDDCVNAARHLAEQGEADGARLAIRGGSAGGYTTLCALTFRPGIFAAGASYYGVADLETLAQDTHKFESRYLDGLVGPYPAARAVYVERSPVHFTDRIACPLIVFQGLDDKVVPPSQAETLVSALEAKGLPYAYLAFEGEQHGFRKAETIVRTLEAELYFYGRIFGFAGRAPADVEPVRIAHLDD